MKNTRARVGVALCSGLALVLCWLISRETPPAGPGTAKGQPEALAPQPSGASLRPAPLRLRRDTARGTSGDAPTAAAQRASPTPGSSKSTTPEQALHRALLQFQFESQPALDGCLGPGMQGPRSIQPVQILFTRQDPRADFVAARLEPVPMEPAQATTALPPQVSRCLERLQGRPLQLQTALPDDPRELHQVVTLLVPSGASPTSTR